MYWMRYVIEPTTHQHSLALVFYLGVQKITIYSWIKYVIEAIPHRHLLALVFYLGDRSNWPWSVLRGLSAERGSPDQCPVMGDHALFKATLNRPSNPKIVDGQRFLTPKHTDTRTNTHTTTHSLHSTHIHTHTRTHTPTHTYTHTYTHTHTHTHTHSNGAHTLKTHVCKLIFSNAHDYFMLKL
jgi:hypothetical protein